MSNTKLYLISFLFFIISGVYSQDSVKSQVIDIEKNRPINDVSVQILDTDRGVFTDKNGFFELERLPRGTELVFSKIGYYTLKVNINFIEDVIYLSPKVSQLDEVVIRSFSSSQLKRTVPDQIYFSKKDIKRLPFILGEKDVIKLIQYTPGVQQAAEGQTGFLVRGGNGSMNLTMLDNIYLHNSAHLGGLFSTVNSDIVHSLEFSKAGFDASYGGRLSSITDIKTLKSPDSTHYNGSLGLLSTKLTGNIKIDKKNSLLLSGRRTYLEVFKPFFGDDSSILGKNKNYFLYDFLTKHSFKIDKKNSIETTLYITRDDFRDQTKGRNRKLKWGNFLLGTTFKHQFSSILSSQTTFSNSFYGFSFEDNDFPYRYQAESTFSVFSINHFVLLEKPSYTLKLGVAYHRNNILPKRVNASVDNSPLEILNQDDYRYDDVNIYGDLNFSISPLLKAKTGLRFTSFFTINNALIDKETFFSMEPRVSLKYKYKENQVFKFSYQRLSQFVHQASVSSYSLPADFFVISTNKIKPQVSNQFSLGYSYEINSLQLNSGVYFKNVANYTEFENGSVNNLFSNNIYEDMLVGEFNSYGFELSVNKKVKKITAQGSLTLSRTLAKFEEINNGNYYPTTFDRPLNINAIVHYKLNNKLEFGALFLFTSGQNYTKPKDIRILNERPILNFEPKNASRFPSYHRLDLSITYSFKRKRKWSSKLNLTLYNVYNNKNPFQIYYSTNGNVDDTLIEITEKKDNLFPFLPTLNWFFSF